MTEANTIEKIALDDLVAQLGRDRVQRNAVLAPLTTFRIGGPADLLYVARSPQELADAVRAARRREVPYFVLGTGANILVGDRGIRGLVIKNEAQGIAISQDETIQAESGGTIAALIDFCRQRGLSGVEHYAGIPSSVGGALWQNLHFLAPDRKRTVYISECLVGARLLTAEGDVRDVDVDYFAFAYDDSVLHHRRDLVLHATFRPFPASPADLDRVIAENLAWRREKHPDWRTFPSAGSIFKKIEGAGAGRLIEQAGLKGLVHGGAQISPRHANFIVNLGGASARDVMTLVELCQASVAERFGLALEMEVGRAGDF